MRRNKNVLQLGELMGWTVEDAIGEYGELRYCGPIVPAGVDPGQPMAHYAWTFQVPAATAPRHRHFEFLGWLSEKMEPEFFLSRVNRVVTVDGDFGRCRIGVDFQQTENDGGGYPRLGIACMAGDLAWTAVRAAIRVKTGKTVP